MMKTLDNLKTRQTDYWLVYTDQHLQLKCNMWRKSYANASKSIHKDKKDISIKFAREEEVKHH